MKNNFELNNQGGYNINNSRNVNRAGKKQKRVAFFVGIFAFLVVVFWSAQFKRNLMEPLNKGASVKKTASESEEDSDLSLKTKDTDSDGLSDWDELNYYKTSPYLDDSDSDGIKDDAEIMGGSDPNCPKGMDCYGVNVFSEGYTGTIPQNSPNSSLLNNTPQSGADQGAGLLLSPEINNDDFKALLGEGKELDALTLRQMLLQAGMDQVFLDKISDEDLIKSYREIAPK